MTESNTFVLVCIMDNALIRHWTIPAADELDVARQMLRNPWSYEKAFWALGIHMSKVTEVHADKLLKAIQDSYMNMNSRPAVLHLVPVKQAASTRVITPQTSP